MTNDALTVALTGELAITLAVIVAVACVACYLCGYLHGDHAYRRSSKAKREVFDALTRVRPDLERMRNDLAVIKPAGSVTDQEVNS